MSSHKRIPDWFADAKFGIYFTWIVYCVPAYKSEWYPYFMYRPENNAYDHHNKTYGKNFEYHQFIPIFKAEHFDAKEWAKLFKLAGAKFAGPCAIHHDGFAMWKSDVNPWNSFDMGPKKEITGELLSALKKEGLKTITTFHHARNRQRNADDSSNWAMSGKENTGYDSHFAYNPKRATSSTDSKLKYLYGNLSEKDFDNYWLAQVEEVVDKYSPDMIWFDSWLNLVPEDYRRRCIEYYFKQAKTEKREVAVGYKQMDLPKNIGVEDIEQGGKKELSPNMWMTDITLSYGSWSYVNGQTYKTADLVLRNMIDVWSKNGVVLLNISPRADGVIPEEQRKVLAQIGEWMKKYGEAVYNTVPFGLYGFGDAVADNGHFGGQSATVNYTERDVRFTMSKDGKNLYMFFLGKPKAESKLEVKSFAPHRYPVLGVIKRVTLLGSDNIVKYNQT